MFLCVFCDLCVFRYCCGAQDPWIGRMLITRNSGSAVDPVVPTADPAADPVVPVAPLAPERVEPATGANVPTTCTRWPTNGAMSAPDNR
jgi:hypothetical protein